MPADTGARAVFRDQDLLQRLRRQAREGGHAPADRQQEVGNLVGRRDLPGAVIITPAERLHPPQPLIAVEFEGLELERANAPDQLGLLGGAKQIRPVGQALGPGLGGLLEKIGLLKRHGSTG